MILANQISEKLTFLILGVKFYATRDTLILYENYSKSLKLIISKFHFLIFQANHDGVTSVVDQVILHDSVIFTQNLELEGNRKNPQSHPSRFSKWCWKKWIKLKNALKKIREVSVYFKIGYSCEYDIYILWVKRRYVPFCQGCWRIMEKRRTKCIVSVAPIHYYEYIQCVNISHFCLFPDPLPGFIDVEIDCNSSMYSRIAIEEMLTHQQSYTVLEEINSMIIVWLHDMRTGSTRWGGDCWHVLFEAQTPQRGKHKSYFVFWYFPMLFII